MDTTDKNSNNSKQPSDHTNIDHKAINNNAIETDFINEIDPEEKHFLLNEESEPYLGPSWAILMLLLYVLKQVFPAEKYTAYWYFQIYILLIVVGITIFTLIKRHWYFDSPDDDDHKNED